MTYTVGLSPKEYIEKAKKEGLVSTNFRRIGAPSEPNVLQPQPFHDPDRPDQEFQGVDWFYIYEGNEKVYFQWIADPHDPQYWALRLLANPVE